MLPTGFSTEPYVIETTDEDQETSEVSDEKPVNSICGISILTSPLIVFYLRGIQF
jgi:hypothetical protein